MRILIRKLVKSPAGRDEVQDLELQTDELTIGRASDQLLYLPGSQVSLRHARVVRKGDQTVMLANGVAILKTAGSEDASVVLTEGTVVGIGPHSVRVIRAPTGFNLALEVTEASTDEKQGVAAVARYDIELSGKGVSKRFLAWLAVLFVLVFGAALPLADNLSPKVHEALSEAGYPFSNFWSSGPLASVHHNSKAVFDCHACHEVPFQAVPNDRCIDCHKFTGNHVHPDHAGFPVMDALHCGECHAEHNEPEQLVQREQGLCTDCHADIKAFDPASPLDNVADFEEAHPSFKVLQHVLDEQGEWQDTRIKLADLKAESSNLKFNHQIHLKPEGILTPDGERVMECSDCHQPDESGWYMLPMTMEKTCRSCHALTFDEDNPERQVPHGKPAEVATELGEYFLGKYSAPRAAQAEQAPQRRGRPGHERAEAFTCQGPAVDCAKRMTEITMTELFERTACYTCHEVKNTGDADIKTRYAVVPVKIVDQWMTGAKFTHADHMTESCDRCHDAQASKVATDVLIPDIDNCRECHGGEGTWGKLNSTCISCHDFHFNDRGYMKPSAILEKVSSAPEVLPGGNSE